MSKEIPRLDTRVLGKNRAYFFRNPEAFPADEWLPTLMEVHSARTMGKQKAALTTAILKVGGSSYPGMPPINPDVSKYGFMWKRQGIYARFKPPQQQDVVPRLTYVKATNPLGKVAAIGYRNPYAENPSTAFSVVDSGNYHAVKDFTDKLSEVEKWLSLTAIQSLAMALDSRDPRFDILPQLEAEGVLVGDQY